MATSTSSIATVREEVDREEVDREIAHADLRHSMRALRRIREEDSEESGPPVVHESFTTWLMTSVNRFDLDASVDPVTKKTREHTSKSATKNRARRSADRLKTFTNDSEADTLRLELAEVHKSYIHILQDKNEKIARDLEDYNDVVRQKDSLKSALSLAIVTRKAIIDDIQNDLEITEEELSISQKSVKEWIGRALKLKFIFDQMKKIEALPEDQAEWVYPMVEQVDIPEVSINIKDEFVPTAQTDNIDWVSSDEEEAREYEASDEEGDLTTPANCSNCGEMTHATCDCTMPQGYMQEEPYGSTINRELDEHGSINVIVPRMAWGATAMYNYRPHCRAILEKSATTIQKAWRDRRTLKKEQLDRELDDFMYCRRAFNKWEWDSDGLHDEWAKVIQRVWRGHHLRKLLEGAGTDRFHQGRESMRAEALLAHNVFLYYSGVPFPAEQL